MRLINIEQYDYETMQLAKAIYDSKKRILLGCETRIHPKYLAKLREIGVQSVFVEDAKSAGITLDEMIDMPKWVETISIVEEAYEQIANKRPLPLKSIQKTVKMLIEELNGRKALILIPTSSIDRELAPFAHSVNVTLIALQMGKQLGYTNFQLNDLGIGCLLHDIGKQAGIEEDKHPEEGFNIIRSNREINLLSAHIAYQHHETIDGEGFPRKLRGEDVIEFAQVCGLANAYENMISRDNISPNDAYERILALSEKKYSYNVVLAFSKSIIGYPPGTSVMLSNGEAGMVTKIISHLQRPVVRLDSSGEEIDLSEEMTIFIDKIIEAEETNQSNESSISA